MSAPLFQEALLIPGAESGAIWRYAKPQETPLHFHGHLEFLLVLRGRMVERFGGRTQTVHAGQLIWHLPSVPHELAFASRDLDMRVIHVEPDVASAMCQRHRANRSSSGRTSRGAAADAPFSGWVRDLGWLAAGAPVVELRRAEVDALLEDCDSDFIDVPPRADPAPRLSRLLQNALCFSMANRNDRRASSIAEIATCLLLEDPSLDRPSVCRLLDVSEGYLSRCFRQELGVSFVTQRARIRISRFTSYAGRERRNMLDAALSAGFGSYSQLHRTFCGVVGMTPVNYLRRGGRQARARLTRC